MTGSLRPSMGVTRGEQTDPLGCWAGQQTELPSDAGVQAGGQELVPSPAVQPACREEEEEW